MTTDLREELTALAETQTFFPDPSAWDRGRRARRNARLATSAAVLAVVALVVGVGAIAVRPDAVGPAGDVAPAGAIPSRVTTPGNAALREPDIGQASVAYVAADGTPVLVDATTGEAHAVELPNFPTREVIDRGADNRRGPWLALSPDGRRLAYPATQEFEMEPGRVSNQTSWYRVVDLTTGRSDLVDLPPYGTTPLGMSWTTDGRIAVDVHGRPTSRPTKANPPPTISWTIDPTTGDTASAPMTGVIAPGGGISATYPESTDPVGAVPFVTSSGGNPARELPPDDYPDGAAVVPIGWADNSLLVAQVDDDLVLLTSPDRPEPEWTWRVLVADAPESLGLSMAVDLVPDLDGSADQELTHDFAPEPVPAERDISWIIGLGVAGAIAVLLGLRWLWRRFRPM